MARETRQQLVDRLRSERDPEVLSAALDHPAWQVRWAAIDGLERVGGPAAEASLIRLIQTSDERADLAHANAALGRIGSDRAIPALAALIHHAVDDVKASAIRALGELGDGSLTPVYLDALSDRSWVAKSYAIEAIHRRGDERAIGPVIDRLRQLLRRDRRRPAGGWSDVMYGLDFLARWQATSPAAAETTAWVRGNALGKLQPRERSWFESKFGGPPA